MRISNYALVALASGAHLAAAQQFQSTPVMGWNSYNQMACSPNEAKITEAIHALTERGFVDAGYVFFQLDCGWASRDGRRNATTGALKIDSGRFPKGLLPLSNLARSKGMRWSMYSDAGTRMCDTEVPSPVAGSLGSEAADADLFRSLNAEYVKYDNCYADGPLSSQNAPKNARTDFVTRFTTMWRELQRVGIKGMLVCQWGVPYSTSNGLKGPSQWTKGVSTSFRLSDDIATGWANVYRIYNQAVHIARSSAIGPGNIADADLLEVGNSGMTFDEQATHFAFWALLKSALMISTNVSALSTELVAVLQNRELIAINQDSAVKPIQLVQRWTMDRDLWAGDLANGDIAVLVVDLSNTRRTLSLRLSELGIKSADAKDLWTSTSTKNISTYSKPVNGHGSIVLRLSNVQRASEPGPEYSYLSVSQGTLTSGANIQPCTSCASSTKVGNLGGSSKGSVVLSNIRTARASQTVRFDYINCEVGYLGGPGNNNERLASISVNGGPAQTVSFPLSGYNWDTGIHAGYGVELSGFSTQEPNSIRISGAGTGWAPDFDRIGVITG
ncbi:alfa-D-galactopyranosidase/beta-L arabinopyranosidase [Xylaria palmicola]|nr:alfa-D-galactopyranosidase/beta-L arabinopyranosidase [Xylaria palmicola]